MSIELMRGLALELRPFFVITGKVVFLAALKWLSCINNYYIIASFSFYLFRFSCQSLNYIFNLLSVSRISFEFLTTDFSVLSFLNQYLCLIVYAGWPWPPKYRSNLLPPFYVLNMRPNVPWLQWPPTWCFRKGSHKRTSETFFKHEILIPSFPFWRVIILVCCPNDMSWNCGAENFHKMQTSQRRLFWNFFL